MTAALGNPFALGAGPTVQTSARTDRLTTGAAFRPGSAPLSAASGLLHGPAGTRGDLTLLTDVLLRVDPFVAIVQGTHNTQQGQYTVPNVQQRDLAVPAKDASLFRRALVRVRVADSLEAGVATSATTDGSWLEVVSGALAASNPALPALGDNALALGELSIPSTASGQPVTLTRYNPRTITRGGVLPMPTEASIVALPTALLWPGFQAFAEDTGANATYDGTVWRWFDTRWQTYTVPLSVTVAPSGNTYPEIAYGNAVREGRYFRSGRHVRLMIFYALGGTTSYAGLSGPCRFDYPPGLRPSTAFFGVTPGARIGGTARVLASANALGMVAHEYNANEALRRLLITYITNDATLQGGASPTWNYNAGGHQLSMECVYEVA